MNTSLLRNLGVNEAIIIALEKSYGDDSQSNLEIMQEQLDLKLLIKQGKSIDGKCDVVSLPGFFKKNTLKNLKADAVPAEARYNCNDVLEFLPESASMKENLRINGVDLRLSDALIKLLRFLAKKTVESKTGWVYIQDLMAEEIIPSDGYQSFSRLRGVIGGYLLKKNPRDLIEANGKKQYRLSVAPNHIKFSNGGD